MNDLLGKQFVSVKFCMNSNESNLDGWIFDKIKSSHHGFEFELDTGEIVSFRIKQIGDWFGLIYENNSILDSMNKNHPPVLISSAGDLDITGILNKKIKKIIFNELTSNRDSNINYFDRIRFILEDGSFSLLTGEYFPDDETLYLQADGVILVFGEEYEKKFKIW